MLYLVYGRFGVIGVALAVVGLYGVIATGVRQRRREFGVRMALGAEARHLRRLVIIDGCRLIGLGMVIGWRPRWAPPSRCAGYSTACNLWIRCR